MTMDPTQPALRQDVKLIGLISVSHGLSHFFQLVVAVLFPLIREDLGVSYAQLGAASALFFTTSALSQTAAGFVVDRFGALRVLYGGLALCSLGIFAVAVAPNYAVLVLGAGIAGVGNSVFHPVDFSILNSRVAQHRLGPAYSVHGFCGALGWTIAPAFAYGVSSLYSWRAALLAAALIGVAMITVLMLGRLGADPVKTQAERKAAETTLKADFGTFLQLPVLLCFMYFVLTAVALTGIQTFGVSAIMALYSAPVGLASSALSAYLFASGIGILGGGYLAMRFKREDRVAVIGIFASALTALALATGAVPLGWVPFVLATGGFLYGLSSPSRDLIVKGAAPAGATGKVYGFVYSGLDVGQMALPVFFGWMLDDGRPEAIFYVTFFALLLAVFTVLRLPKRRRIPAAAPAA